MLLLRKLRPWHAQADQCFVVYGGENRFRLKPGIEAISLPLLQKELLVLGDDVSA